MKRLSPQQSSPTGEEFTSPVPQDRIEEDIQRASPTPQQPNTVGLDISLKPVEEEPNIANLYNYEKVRPQAARAAQARPEEPYAYRDVGREQAKVAQ